jgi:hypothetical protein
MEKSMSPQRPDATSRLRSLPAEDMASELMAQEAKRDPGWMRILERFGFPMLVSLGLAYGFVGYNRQVREDAAAVREHWKAVVADVVKEHKEERGESKALLEKANQLLQEIRDTLRDRGERSRR